MPVDEVERLAARIARSAARPGAGELPKSEQGYVLFVLEDTERWRGWWG
ncbi:hypothetical protein ACB264_06080 [Klebsiella pneumoniae]